MSSYQDDPSITPLDELKLELCMSISDGSEVDGDIQKQVLPVGKYVVMDTELDESQEYGPAWNTAFHWMEKNNCEADMSRSSYPICSHNPEEHPEKHHILDICMSVKT
jgi:AraC family transcriptional regulator